MKVSDLAPNPKNPRRTTDAKLSALRKALLEFGDLSGIVFNRKSGQLVGGHQRTRLFDENSQVTILRKYSKPTRTGTVAEGFVLLEGERFAYREVVWSKHKEMAANLAANKAAGTWDNDIVSEMLKELGSFDADLDIDLTMFDEGERRQFNPVEDFIAEEHWTEKFEPPSKQFQFVVTILDEKRKREFLKRIGVKTIRKKTGNVWSVTWPDTP